MKRRVYARQIRHGVFATTEPEYARLPEWLKAGDWVLDIGANVGHYTKRCSDLVGLAGRVIAFEPVPETFSLLAANTRLFAHRNVSLVNAAVSDRCGTSNMVIPQFASGLPNYYEAELMQGQEGGISVLTLSIDSLCIPVKISLVKVDAENHEALVLSGMMKLLEADHPRLIIETGSGEIVEKLEKMGYRSIRLSGSPNILFEYPQSETGL